ncbi:MAG: hypothetical protein CME64_06200 [Halobacteriovoraceae bacterium]|nr:hypothetical protein [Halobacteriovoraceae bacterium]|tara:strand:+ start:107360 stop:107998 length:639 start_codon:yes stop_codon:yes gene_type:complete
MGFKTTFLTFTLALISTSCAMLDRRDFYEQMDTRFDQPMFMPEQDFAVVPGDTGRAYRAHEEIMGRAPATAAQQERSRYDNSIKRELSWLESRLSDQNYNDYLRVREQLGSDYERIYYLRLAPAQQAEYLGVRGIAPSKSYNTREVAQVFFSNNLSLRMSKQQVLNSWGEPDRLDKAGNDPSSGNERWAYHRGGKVKFIYFEDGLVEGWSEQ